MAVEIVPASVVENFLTAPFELSKAFKEAQAHRNAAVVLSGRSRHIQSCNTRGLTDFIAALGPEAVLPSCLDAEGQIKRHIYGAAIPRRG